MPMYPAGPVTHPDAALAMLTWMRAAVAAVPIDSSAIGLQMGTRMPASGDIPLPFCRIRRSGGTVLDTFEDSPRLDFQVWHATDAQRMRLGMWLRSLALSARGSVVTMPDGTLALIGRVTEFVGPGQFPDPEKPDREIVLFTVEARMRGRAAA